jgi:hypothetical protein
VGDGPNRGTGAPMEQDEPRQMIHTKTNDTYPDELYGCRRTLRGGRACTVWRSTRAGDEASAASTTPDMSTSAANRKLRLAQLRGEITNT